MRKPADGQLPPRPASEGPERDHLVRETVAKAHELLKEAASLNPALHGHMIAHGCYYASFWLARALMVKLDGTYPYRHETTEARFLEIVQAAGEQSALAEAYGIYVDTAKERSICDYDRSYRPSAARSQQIINGMHRFFELVTAMCVTGGGADGR